MRLEVADQRGARLVDVVRHLVKIFRERLARAAVAVPVGVVKLDEPRAALHQPPGQQTVVGKTRLTPIDAIEVERGLGFLGKIHQFRRAGLHAIGHLVRGDAGVDLRVARGHEPFQVELIDDVDRTALPG